MLISLWVWYICSSRYWMLWCRIFLFYFYIKTYWVCAHWICHNPQEVFWCKNNKTGPSCSKLTMSLVNVSLNFDHEIWHICWYFCWKNVSSFCICKSYSHFFSKNACELDIVLTRTVKILTTNELVKLRMLWTTGPWSSESSLILTLISFIF